MGGGRFGRGACPVPYSLPPPQIQANVCTILHRSNCLIIQKQQQQQQQQGGLIKDTLPHDPISSSTYLSGWLLLALNGKISFLVNILRRLHLLLFLLFRVACFVHLPQSRVFGWLSNIVSNESAGLFTQPESRHKEIEFEICL